MKACVVAVFAILAVVAAAEQSEGVNCGQVDAELSPCVNYLIGRESYPPKPCCDGVRTVKGLAVTVADKRAACGCVKAAAISYGPALKDAAAQSLAAKCDVPLDIPVSRTVDCDRIA